VEPEAQAEVEGEAEVGAELEAALPFNCEHVVPQSWFRRREPMRGDLHHLFACEARCNSFRGNTPFGEFADFPEPTATGPALEVVRGECGKSEANGFEPVHGKGPPRGPCSTSCCATRGRFRPARCRRSASRCC
jgi:endonuclease I